LWHIDPLLGNDRETNNKATAFSVEHLYKYATVLEPLLGCGPHASMEVLIEAVFSTGPLRGYTTLPTELAIKLGGGQAYDRSND
jgi:hypothetical protein